MFLLKEINFLSRKVKIVIQNENGPCPLLALVNTLLLRKAITIPMHKDMISLDELLAMVAGRMLDSNKSEDKNMQQNIQDAIAILSKLATGIDVNPKFHSTKGFEFTDEIAIFDLLDISLYHGWIVDPEDDVASFLTGLSYNQVVEFLINMDYKINRDIPATSTSPTDKSSATEDMLPVRMSISCDEGPGDRLVSCSFSYDEVDAHYPKKTEIVEAQSHITENDLYKYQLIKTFLGQSASQLTNQGLFCVCAEMKDNELAVFFRNNHFSTIFKHDNVLHLLVTDVGYHREQEVIWEILNDVDGNTQFVNGLYKQAGSSAEQAAHELAWNENAAVEAATLLSNMSVEGGGSKDDIPSSPPTVPYGALQQMYSGEAKNAQPSVDADYALALQLQEEFNADEENSRIQMEEQRLRQRERNNQMQSRRQEQQGRSKKKSDRCTIM